MAVKVLTILGLCALLTACQLPVWSSNVALWEQAVVYNRVSPRPAFNLADAYQRDGRYYAAVRWYDTAIRRATEEERPRYLALVRRQVELMELHGFFPCESALWPSVCPS